MSVTAGANQPQAPIVNPANAVTVLRFLLAPVLAAVYWEFGGGMSARLACCLIFVVAMATDWIDGYLARRYGWITEFGKVVDPLADKVVVGTALIVLSLLHQLWWTVVILLREAGMTMMRKIARRRGYGSMPASRAGKRKTFTQCIAVPLYLAPLEYLLPVGLVAPLRWALMALVVWFTYESLVRYWCEFRRLARLA